MRDERCVMIPDPASHIPHPVSRLGAALLLLAASVGWAAPAARALAEEAPATPAANLAGAFGALSAEDAERVAALVKQLGHDDWQKRESASADLIKAGEGAIPALLAVADGTDIEVVQRATELLDKLVPKSRIYGLLRARRSPAEIVEELGGGEKAFAVLLGCLNLPKAAARFELRSRALGIIGACGKPAVPVLTETLASADQREAEVAAAGLATIGPDAAGAVPGLVKTLDGQRPALRGNSARALGAIGPAAKDALPALEKALEDKDATVRIETALAVWRLQGKAGAEKVTAALTKALGESDSRVRAAALQALGAMGPDAAGATAAIAKVLEDPKVCEGALSVLGGIGPGAKEALPAVQAKLEDKNDAVRLQAALAQLRITDRGADAVKALIEAMADKDPRMRELAIRLLGDIGPEAKEAVPALEKLLEDKKLRGPAKDALGKIRGKAAPADKP